MKMNSIIIETAANGFIARERSPMEMASYQPFVFESFESLTVWLKEQLVDNSDA
jgi:hypothetical protein